MKTYNNQKNLIINKPTTPLDLNNCENIVIKNPNISGGNNNICMTGCKNCKIIGGTLKNPDPTVSDPDDPENHNIIFNNCYGCSATNVTCSGASPRGDALNAFNSTKCVFKNMVINGPLAPRGTACIIDGPDGNNNTIYGLTINSLKARVVICGGKGHVFQNTIVTGAVEVTGEYYDGATVINLKIINVSGPELYVNVATVKGLITKNCNFKVINKE